MASQLRRLLPCNLSVQIENVSPESPYPNNIAVAFDWLWFEVIYLDRPDAGGTRCHRVSVYRLNQCKEEYAGDSVPHFRVYLPNFVSFGLLIALRVLIDVAALAVIMTII
ncbi:MAG: hypothetical protein AAFU54_22005 [Chloroflexota bacterium]